MKKLTLLTMSTLLAGMAFAQETTVFENADIVDDQVSDIEDAVQTDLEKSDDSDRFVFSDEGVGQTGSIAARIGATSGNSDTFDAGIAGRVTYGSNGWDQTFQLAYDYASTEGETTKDRRYAAYDVSRSFNNEYFVFGQARAVYDEFGAFESDAFVGAGIGYRILNDETSAWRIQAGPGYRLTKLQGEESVEEFAGILSSRYYRELSDQVTITNDTDVLYSEADTLVTNDLAVNYAFNNMLQLRASVRSDYHTDPLEGRENTDLTTGLALVYEFE